MSIESSLFSLFLSISIKCSFGQLSTPIPTTQPLFPTSTPSSVNPEKSKFTVGMIVTEVLQTQIGYSLTGGVIPLALQQIAQLHLIDSIEFEFLINYTDCTEADAAGVGVYLMKDKEVDVVLGPPCGNGIIPVGFLSTYYQTLQVAWGYASASTLSDATRFPYITTVVPNYRQLGYAFVSLTLLFEWDTVALLYGDNGYGACTNMINDVTTALTDPVYNVTTIASTQKIDASLSLTSMITSLQKIRPRARIVGVCLPDDTAKRNFLIATTQAGMNGSEYVYVLLDLRGFGFGQLNQAPDQMTLDSGYTPIWIDTVNNNKDGLNDVAQQAATQMLVIDLTNQGTVNGETTAQLAPEILENVRGPPLYCNTTDCLDNDSRYTGVGNAASIGSFAQQLYDAFMYYAYCLNASLAIDPLNGGRNQTVFNSVRNTISFTGWSGLITMTPNSTRVPRFFLYGVTATGTTSRYANFTWSGEGDYMVATPLYTDEASTIWAARGGARPLSTPICGFLGNDCPLTTWEQSGIYICIGGGVAVLLILIFGILLIYIAGEKRKERNRQDAEWQIPYLTLERAGGRGSRNEEKSMHSLHSSKSSQSKFSMGSKAETANLAYFFYNGEPVSAYKYKMMPKLVKEDFAEFRMLRKLENDNVHRFIGICHDHSPLMSIWKFASRGTLDEVVAKGTINLDAFFAMSLIRDLSEGLFFIHKSFLGVHGNLCAQTCWIDERWQLKISGFGCRSLRQGEKVEKKRQLYWAPEVLRSPTSDPTKEADIYAFAIICSEIVTRRGAFDLENRNEKVEELLYMIKRGSSIPVRPSLNVPEEMELNPAVLHMIRDCWSDQPDSRPAIATIKTIIKSMAQADGGQQNLMDHVFNLMESYAETLEKEVQDRMTELVEEKKKSDILLYRMLPKQVADKLKLGQSVEPESFDSVTIFFSDVVQFTNLAAKCSPLQIVNLLNDLYTTFDQIIEQHSVYKVETIGDGYLCVSGLPHRNGINHVKEIAEMSLDFLKAVQIFRVPHLPAERINLRIGMHSGSCVAGVVGLAMPRYCLFGDTVNTASRMESNGKPGRIHMSTDAAILLNQLGGYLTETRGEVIIKGKGVMETFWLIGRMGTAGSDLYQSTTIPSNDRQDNRFFRARETTPPMANETRLQSSADSPDLPNYDEAKGMYRQATWE